MVELTQQLVQPNYPTLQHLGPHLQTAVEKKSGHFFCAEWIVVQLLKTLLCPFKMDTSAPFLPSDAHNVPNVQI